MPKTIHCHLCGAELVRDLRSDTVEYKGRSVSVQQPGWYHPIHESGCDEVVLEGTDAVVSEAAFIRLKADTDGILTPDEVRVIREKLGLSQRAAGRVLGGGPRSFQKYESGTDWVTRSMANLLRLLDSDPSRLKELTGERDLSSPKTKNAATRRKQPASKPQQRHSTGAD